MTTTPFGFTPAQYWDGNDGSWSTFAVRVGVPAQVFRVLPSTTGQETWVPASEGCVKGGPIDCASLRGAFTSPFRPNASSSWKELGVYDLALDHELGYNGSALFGLDKIGLQIPESEGPDLDGQVVAALFSDEFYVGVLGLGPKPQGEIPSLSYGYTAGAPYRAPKVFGSLTLGGYDESRLLSNDIIYPFDPDDSRSLSISIESITASGSLQGRTTLLGDDHQVYAPIDSTIPHLWLPRDVCDRFEQAFGLVYDHATDLYRVNLTARDTLLGSNASITIGLGLGMDPARRTNIVLPYEAFDLQASHPWYPNATHYFPIRRAANASQYRLGRAFLQEAYVIADYERSQFSIHQARFETPMPAQKLISILPPESGLNPPNDTHHPENPEDVNEQLSAPLGRGAIAGIAVGSCAGVALCVVATLLLMLRQRRKIKIYSPEIEECRPGQFLVAELHPRAKDPPELQDAQICEMYEPPREVDGRPRSPALLSDESQDVSGETSRASGNS